MSKDKTANGSTKKWLTIIGIGEDGVSGLSDKARTMLKAATHVFGGKRHLELAGELINGEPCPWPQPFDPAMTAVLALRENLPGSQNICVLASGDPNHFGVGVTLSRVISLDEMEIIPNHSAFTLAAAALAWPMQSVTTLSLHGRDIANLRRHLRPGAKILALTSGAKSPSEIAEYICQHGFSASKLNVMEALGGPNQTITTQNAASFDMQQINPLNLLAIEVHTDNAASRIIPNTPGLPDDWFDHDGQITKCEIRALTIAALAPKPGELLWDIGAGSGSVSIEWLLSGRAMQAIAVEHKAERAARIRANANALGAPGLEIIEGKAPSALADISQPDAIFIGGGGTNPGVMEAAIKALPMGGRLVANGVTIEMEEMLNACAEKHGGTLIRLEISRKENLGTMTAWRPALPITQWSWRKT